MDFFQNLHTRHQICYTYHIFFFLFVCSYLCSLLDVHIQSALIYSHHNAACFNNQSYLKISIRNTAGYSCHIRNNYSTDLLFADHIHNLIPLAINISLRKAIASYLSHD